MLESCGHGDIVMVDQGLVVGHYASIWVHACVPENAAFG